MTEYRLKGLPVDDTPRLFAYELRSSLLKKFVGRVAVAIILAEAFLRFINALTWFLVIPAIAVVLKGNTESVLFKNQKVFPWEQLVGSVVEFAGTLILVFYANRWINHPIAKLRPLQFTSTCKRTRVPLQPKAISPK